MSSYLPSMISLKLRTVSRSLHTARHAGKLLGHVEGLRQEFLHFSGASHGELVFFRKLVDAQNRNDVLQILVALQNLLHALGHVVVILTTMRALKMREVEASGSTADKYQLDNDG